MLSYPSNAVQSPLFFVTMIHLLLLSTERLFFFFFFSSSDPFYIYLSFWGYDEGVTGVSI